jgi:uncharacterized membrane protein
MTLGALESIVVGFDHPDFRGAIADEIGRVIDAGIVRLVDAVVVRKDAAGDVAIVEVDNKEDPHFAAFEPLIKDAIALFTPEDLALFAQGIPNDTAALVLLFEHRWMERIKDAMADAGGVLLSRAMIDPETMEALSQELEAELAAPDPVA